MLDASLSDAPTQGERGSETFTTGEDLADAVQVGGRPCQRFPLNTILPVQGRCK